MMVPKEGEMKFGRAGKTLADPPRTLRANAPVAPCKCCARMPPQCAITHEAYTCEENFKVGGVQAKSFRQLFHMGVMDKAGVYI